MAELNTQDDSQTSCLVFEFSGAIWYWKGPSPFHFVTVPERQSSELKSIAHLVTYGWGMIPVQAQIGATRFGTAMFHKDGLYVLPVKAAIRKAEGIEEGDTVPVRLEVQVAARLV